MEEHCQQEEAALGGGRALLAQLQAQQVRMDYNLQHLPERLPGFAKAAAAAQPPAATAAGAPQSASAPAATSAPLQPNNRGPAKAGPSKTKTAAKPKAPAVPTPPVIAYVRADEFETVPKYVRGRLTQADVNKVVDAVQATLNEKYRLLTIPRPQLSDVVRGGRGRAWERT